MAYDEFTAIMVKKNTELEAQLATVQAERDDARELNRINGEALTELANGEIAAQQARIAAERELAQAQQREERCKLALLDFLRTYAPEEFTDEQVGESHKRIRDHGGTLAYIAGLLHDKETQP